MMHTLAPLQGNRWVLLGPVRAYFTTTEGGAAISQRLEVWIIRAVHPRALRDWTKRMGRPDPLGTWAPYFLGYHKRSAGRWALSKTRISFRELRVEPAKVVA